MFRVMSANLNGIRSATTKGFFPWFLAQDVDVLCLQETRARESQLTKDVLAPSGYRSWFFEAEKPGYSGTAIYARLEPRAVRRGVGDAELDSEGRVISADFGSLIVTSLYMPSGSSGDARQEVKNRSLDVMGEYFRASCASGKPQIVCGDINIAHTPIDIENWRGNQGTSGFLPHERAWLDTLFEDVGMIDAFRLIDDRPKQYTWWSARGQARAKNVGWRIDYHLVTPGIRPYVTAAQIHREPFFSDHAPLVIDYSLKP